MATTNEKIDFERAEVTKRLHAWRMISDCLEGEEAIRAAGDRYLPRPCADDTSLKNKARYESYLKRARFYNVAQRTHSDLLGQAFQKEPTIEIDRLLLRMGENIDGQGTSLVQHAKRTEGTVLGLGRAGLLADFPTLKEPASQADVLSGKVAPTIVFYEPQQIINWRTSVRNSVRMLTKLVLKECAEIDSGFELGYEQRWRVLELTAEGCTSTLWRRASGENAATALFETVTDMALLRDHKGRPFDFIPFRAVGSVNNDIEIDRAPLYDICSLNIGHWCNSADWEESCFQLGQPTPVVTGLSEDWFKRIMEGKIAFGSMGGVPLGQGMDLKLVQASPNTMAAEGMRDKEARMKAIGAKLLEPNKVVQTASEARINYASELSVLGTISSNVASAYATLLNWCGLFIGATKPSVFTLSTDFDAGKLTPDELRAVGEIWAKDGITTSEHRAILTKAGYATLSLEEYKSEIEANPRYTPPTIPGVGVRQVQPPVATEQPRG